MSQVELLIEVLKKYKFHLPLAKEEKKKILAAKKRTLVKILALEKRHPLFLNTFVNFYYLLLNRGVSFSLTKSLRVFNFTAAALVLIVSLGIVLSVQYQMKTAIMPPARATVTFVVGKVWITRADGKATLAGIKDVIQKDDVLKTEPDSRVMLHIGAGTVVKIEPNSVVKMSSLLENGRTHLQLNTGTILTKLKSLKKNESYEIRTHTAVAAVRGTEFSISYKPYKPYKPYKTTIAVKQGLVYIEKIDPETKRALQKKKLSQGFRAEVGQGIRQKIKQENLSELDGLMVQKISIAPFIDDVENKTRAQLREIGEKQYLEEQKIDKLIGSLLSKTKRKKNSHLSLSELRKKYNRIDQVILYTGKVYKGIILSRGATLKLLTPKGIVKIPAKKVKHTLTR